jgi:MinD-like ATPase involved in chromosome partitioning or flagellar assembly
MAGGTPPLGRILTFYSYKGGTGRSMALANLAWVLACAGRRVLAIDWDLEAPGLHRYFRPFLLDDEITASEGLMDLVDNYANQAIQPASTGQPADADWYVPFTDFSDYIVSVNFPHFRTGGKIDLLPAGRQGDHYAVAVSSFNWQNFYDRLGGGGFFEAVKQRAREQYDYVLIDSRTGVSDTAGICSVQMPDTLVVCFTYNNQSIKGATAIARSATAMHDKLVTEKLMLHRTVKASAAVLEETARPYRIFPVPMRVDPGESDRLAIRQAFAKHSFADFVNHIGADAIAEYWKNVEVPHTSFYSYEEVLAPFKDDAHDPKTLLAAVLRLTRYVTEGDVTDFQMPIAPEQKQAFLDAFAETPLTTKTSAALAESQRESEEQTLVRTGDAAVATLTDSEQAIARRVLGRVIRVGRKDEGERDISIRANLGDFRAPEVAVIRELASHRVLTIEKRPGTQGDLTVGLADPRLLTSWRTLSEWIEQDREFLLWRQQLRTYLGDWDRSDHDAGALLSGRLLSEADLATVRRSADLNDAELFYIDSSRKAAVARERLTETPTTVIMQAQAEGHAAPRAQAPVQKVSRPLRPLLWAASAIVLLASLIVIATAWRPEAPAAHPTATGTTGAPPRPVDPPSTSLTVRAPALVGLTAGDAKKAAEAIGLKVLMSDGRSEDVPFLDGVVVSQQPAHDTSLEQGQAVHLTVSTVTASAPTLVGLDLTEALKALDNARLKLGKTDRRYVSDTRPGTVITQTPAPGIRAAAGTPVDVVVARAAQISDFRVGIYFDEGSDDSRKLADRLRLFLKQAGSESTLVPRSAEFFTGRLQPKGNEIRYSSPTEKTVADQLDHLLQTSGQFPPFTPMPVRQRSEGTIAVFLANTTPLATDSVLLTLVGYPGDEVQIWRKADSKLGKNPVLYSGQIGSDGRVVVSVPRAYLFVGRRMSDGGVPIDLSNEQTATRTVDLMRKKK